MLSVYQGTPVGRLCNLNRKLSLCFDYSYSFSSWILITIMSNVSILKYSEVHYLCYVEKYMNEFNDMSPMMLVNISNASMV